MKSQAPSHKFQTRTSREKIFEICNLRLRAFHESGFTLVELLAVMVVFISIGIIVVSILITSFRTSNKTDVLTTVRQNGDYAITQMAKTLRDARGLVDPYPCAAVSPTPVSSITVTTQDDNQVTYSCLISPSTIASNGASLLDTSAITVASCSFTCTQASSSDLPFILIDFSLNQKSTSTFAEQRASASALPFQTSVVIRNINR